MESELFEDVQKECVLRGLSEKTQAAYLGALAQLQKHFNKDVGLLTKEEIKSYLLYLIQERGLSQSSVTTVYSALKFYFKNLRHDNNMLDEIPRTKKPKRLPQVLAREEVKRLITSIENVKHKCILLTTYSAGLRVSEAAHLRVNDIDSRRMLIRVNQGKGRKDRYTILSPANLKWLRAYYRQYRPDEWLFTGYDRRRSISVRAVEAIFKNAKQKAMIAKDVSRHSLRHSFATHLVEAGIGIHHVQKLLGHSSIKTTTIYLHLAHPRLSDIGSPVDFPEL
jgi:integrase/recombinase XerD